MMVRLPLMQATRMWTLLRLQRICVLLFLCTLFLCTVALPVSLQATDYHVGDGQTISKLSLVPTLQNDDVIILYSNDESLNHQNWSLGGKSITIKSNDSSIQRLISMTGTRPDNGGILDNPDGNVTLNLDGITFSNGKSTKRGGAIYVRDLLTINGGGNYTFNNNSAGYVDDVDYWDGFGGAIYANDLIFNGSGNYNFNNNSSRMKGGAIYAFHRYLLQHPRELTNVCRYFPFLCDSMEFVDSIGLVAF